jgi:predicted helicase
MTYTMLFMTISGFILNWLYRAFDYTYSEIRKKLVCSITLQSKDDLFKIVRSYLTHAGYLQGSMTDLKVAPKKKKDAHWWDHEEFMKQGQEKMQVEYLPGPGDHIFTYKGKQMWIAINEQ